MPHQLLTEEIPPQMPMGHSWGKIITIKIPSSQVCLESFQDDKNCYTTGTGLEACRAIGNETLLE